MGKTKGAAPSSIARLTPTQERNRLRWARRHPERAAEERGMRKQRVETLDQWSHKNEGTAETHAAHSRKRVGAIARLHASGFLNDDELAWSQEIAAAAERIMADAFVRTASLETRVDASRHSAGFYEALGSVWSEMAYGQWRAAIGANGALVLNIIVHDVGLVRAAGMHGASAPKARRVLKDALQAWANIHRSVREQVTDADLIAAQAGLL